MRHVPGVALVHLGDRQRPRRRHRPAAAGVSMMPGATAFTVTPLRAELEGGRLGERDDAALRRAVRGRPRPAGAAPVGRHVHDPPPAALDHRRGAGPDARERAGQVGVDDAPELAGADLLDTRPSPCRPRSRPARSPAPGRASRSAPCGRRQRVRDVGLGGVARDASGRAGGFGPPRSRAPRARRRSPGRCRWPLRSRAPPSHHRPRVGRDDLAGQVRGGVRCDEGDGRADLRRASRAAAPGATRRTPAFATCRSGGRCRWRRARPS